MLKQSDNRNRIPGAILRKMGYRSDSQGIMDRYINVNGAWDGHLNHTRQFITRATSGKEIKNLAVYGSGWLLDFPLEEICSRAGHVWLYDMVHPSQVLHRIRKFSQVTAVVADITGGAVMATFRAVNDYKRKGIKPDYDRLFTTFYEPDIKPDYAISLNILSQLGDMITRYLQHHMPLSDAETERIISLIQRSHLNMLPPRRSCLITDVQELRNDQDNKPEAVKDLVKCSIALPKPSETWEWQFDPLGDYNPGLKTMSKVWAIEL